MPKKTTKKKKRAAVRPARRRVAAKKKSAKRMVKPVARKNARAPARKPGRHSISAKGGASRAERAEALITKGRERGYITYSEILKEFPTIEEDIGFLDELYGRFSTAG